MRVNNVRIVVLLLLFNILESQTQANAQQLLFGNSPPSDSTVMNFKQIADSLPWGNSLYLSAGWGVPQGFRGELGYNFGTSLSLGLSFGISDTWSRDPAEGTLAILGSIRFPLQSSSVTPYILLCRGGTLSIFGNSDTYTLLYIGAMITVRPWLHLRPETGVAFTSKHISGGRSLLGGTTPEVADDKTRFGMNVSFELDFAQLF